jgi:hypothetical protein
MELKKFKKIRLSLAETLATWNVSDSTNKIEIVKINDHFVVYMNDTILESFRTMDAAKEAALDAADSLGNENE